MHGVGNAATTLYSSKAVGGYSGRSPSSWEYSRCKDEGLRPEHERQRASPPKDEELRSEGTSLPKFVRIGTSYSNGNGYRYASNRNALTTTTMVDPSWAITAGPREAMPRIVSGTRMATTPRLIHRFCLMMRRA